MDNDPTAEDIEESVFDAVPVDPQAADFDDADEGADLDGTPITSLHGSENDAWEGETDDVS